MKALFAGIVIGGCSVVSALAADLAVKAPPYLPPAAEMNWSGLYAGVQGGYGWGNSNYSFPPVGGLTLWAPDAGGAFSQGLDGGVFGGHIGFNHQTSNWVVGLEGSFDWSGLKGTSSNVFPPALVPPGATYNSDLKWLATITPRLGYAANRWLFYVKGGLAAGQFNSSVTSTAVAPSIVVQEKNRQAGWTAGAGVEYAATNNWIVGLEYNYFDLGSERYGGNAYQAGVPTNFGDYNVAARFSTINARLSYKWDDRAAASISPMPTKAPTYTASTGNWTGFYAGIHGGYGWGNAPYAFSPHSPVAGGAWAPLSGGTFGDNIGGGLFGGHSGYNHQMGNWVLGLEGSFAWSGLKGSTLDLLPGGVLPTVDTKLEWLATVTPRLGYATNNWLVYGKGGLAVGRVKSTLTSPLNNPLLIFNEKNDYVGWTLGAGVEYALNTNWIVGLEYNYVDLGSQHYGGIAYFGGVPGSDTDYSVKLNFSTVLARLSYKFGAPAALAAKY